MFIGKDFVSKGLFKNNVLLLSINENTSFNHSHVLNTKSYDMWHGRRGHVNHRSIMKIFNWNLIPKIKIDHTKCEICAQSKQPRKLFKPISIRNTQKLELVSSDVCDSNRRPTRDESRYFVTFIDYFFKYYYIS